MNRLFKLQRPLLFALLFLLLGIGVVLAQYGGRRGGRGGFGGRRFRSYDAPPRDIFPSNTFTFCRIEYDSAYGRGRGGGCFTDYPD